MSFYTLDDDSGTLSWYVYREEEEKATEDGAVAYVQGLHPGAIDLGLGSNNNGHMTMLFAWPGMSPQYLFNVVQQLASELQKARDWHRDRSSEWYATLGRFAVLQQGKWVAKSEMAR